jgi:hypothetical protein|tara:strand:+ start:1247 stop:1555 length:309 start_codon:yes stop_codon:yes gene_type:complete
MSSQQAWEFQESQYSKRWIKVELTGRRRVTRGNPNYNLERLVELEVEAGLYQGYGLEGYAVVLKDHYYEARWVPESEIKVLGELTTVTYRSDGTVEENKDAE